MTPVCFSALILVAFVCMIFGGLCIHFAYKYGRVDYTIEHRENGFQQLDAINNRIELKKGNWLLRFKCCDCELVHMMSFAVEDNGNLGIAIDRLPPNECPDCKIEDDGARWPCKRHKPECEKKK